MEKKHIIILSFLLLITIAVMSIAVVQFTEKTPELDFSKLELNQSDAYVSISSNDLTGYNRWLPFTFRLEQKGNTNNESIVALLNKNVKKATLYSETNENLFSTNELIWTALEMEDGSYNLALVIIPNLDELKLDKATNVRRITFDTIDGEKIEYTLPSYVVEARETIRENELYVATTTVEVGIQQDLSATVTYGFIGNIEMTDFALDYPKNFANISKHEIYEPIISEDEGISEYQVALYFSEPAEPNQKIVFRPFLQVYSENNSGWLIPPLPAYIYCNQERDWIF